MNNLRRIYIKLDIGNSTVIKFFGMVGQVPYIDQLSELRGMIVLYRTALERELLSKRLNFSIGVDCVAWEQAVLWGARGLIIFCTDTNVVYMVGRKKIEESSRVHALRRYQYNVRLESCDIQHDVGMKDGTNTYFLEMGTTLFADDVVLPLM